MKSALLKALRIVAATDGGALRTAAFEDIMCQNRLISWIVHVQRSLKHSPFSLVSDLMMAILGYTSFGISVPSEPNGRILAMATYPNEKREIAYLQKCMGETFVILARISRLQVINPRNLLAFLLLFPRYFRLSRKINARYDFLPAARIMQALGYYLAFSRIVRRHSFAAVAAASNYSPDALGLILAAHAQNIPSIFISHALYGVNDHIPDLCCDLSLLSGQVELDEYKQTSLPKGRVLLRGIEGEERPLQMQRLKVQGMTIGIFLTGLLNRAGLEACVDALYNRLSPSLILIRQHPVRWVHHDLSHLPVRYPALEITWHTPLLEDLVRCDLIVSGNSNVHLMALKYGVPTAYLSSLDNCPYDFKRFVSGGIVPDFKDARHISISTLEAFYRNRWEEKFCCFDAAYQMSPRETDAAVCRAVLDIVKSAISINRDGISKNRSH